jgi:hypothetical protein
MSSYPVKNGAYYDPRFADVTAAGEVIALDQQQDEREAKAIISMIKNIKKARTVAIT